MGAGTASVDSRPRLYRVSAVVIRLRNLGEADRVVTLFTRERGKLSAVAKGVKRSRSKLAGGLQLFCHSHVQLAKGRSLEVVTQVQSADVFYHLRENLDTYSHACYVAELLSLSTEEDSPDHFLFDLLLDTLRALNAGADAATLARAFELKLMTRLGYGPETEVCVACGEAPAKGAVGFSAARGGVVCRKCLASAAAAPLSGAALTAMRELIAMPVSDAAQRRLAAGPGRELARLVRAFVDYRLDRRPESAAFLPQ